LDAIGFWRYAGSSASFTIPFWITGTAENNAVHTLTWNTGGQSFQTRSFAVIPGEVHTQQSIFYYTSEINGDGKSVLDISSLALSSGGFELGVSVYFDTSDQEAVNGITHWISAYSNRPINSDNRDENIVLPGETFSIYVSGDETEGQTAEETGKFTYQLYNGQDALGQPGYAFVYADRDISSSNPNGPGTGAISFIVPESDSTLTLDVSFTPLPVEAQGVSSLIDLGNGLHAQIAAGYLLQYGDPGNGWTFIMSPAFGVNQDGELYIDLTVSLTGSAVEPALYELSFGYAGLNTLEFERWNSPYTFSVISGPIIPEGEESATVLLRATIPDAQGSVSIDLGELTIDSAWTTDITKLTTTSWWDVYTNSNGLDIDLTYYTASGEYGSLLGEFPRNAYVIRDFGFVRTGEDFQVAFHPYGTALESGTFNLNVLLDGAPYYPGGKTIDVVAGDTFSERESEFWGPYTMNVSKDAEVELAVTFTPAYEPPFGQPGSGDVDGDKYVTITDAILVLRHIAGLDQLTPGRVSAANFTGESSLTIANAIKILRIVAGLPN
jgi:hypothetical protein